MKDFNAVSSYEFVDLDHLAASIGAGERVDPEESDCSVNILVGEIRIRGLQQRVHGLPAQNEHQRTFQFFYLELNREISSPVGSPQPWVRAPLFVVVHQVGQPLPCLGDLLFDLVKYWKIPRTALAIIFFRAVFDLISP